MKWLELISKLLIQYSVQRQQIQAAPEKIKGMSIQAAAYVIGIVFFLVLGLASIILIFMDLGKQWDSETPTHFSGSMMASVLMFVLGAIGCGISIAIAKYLARKKEAEKSKEVATQDQAPPSVVNPITLFGEEFIVQLISKLKQ